MLVAEKFIVEVYDVTRYEDMAQPRSAFPF
jgi:hypothetical protein